LRAVQALFDRVRAAAERSAWSSGVELARADAVTQERSSGGEIVLRVRPNRGLIHPTVLLYADDGEWECDCGDDEDPCAHVAAAVIALRRAQQEGRTLAAAAEAGGAIGYRFTTQPTGLALTRVVVGSGGETPLPVSLAALGSGRAAGPRVSPTQSDVAAELALGAPASGPLPRGVLRGVLAALGADADVTLDALRVRPNREPVGWRVRVVDDPRGFRVFFEPEPAITRALPDGFALCGDELREIGPLRLLAREREELAPPGRVFSPDEVPALVADVIPDLESRLPVSIETTRLARGRREPPRLRIETERSGDALSVLATIVYGDPPTARVDAGRLVSLGGAIPIRDEAAERELERRLARQLGLAAGHRSALPPNEAIAFRERAQRADVTLVGDAHRAFFLAPGLDPELSLAGERFGLRFRGSGGGAGAPAERVLAAWRSGESLVALDGGGFAPLPAEWLARLGPLVSDLLAARRPDASLPASALPDVARLCDALEQPRPPGFERLAALLADFAGLPEAPLSPELAPRLRSYQALGVRWLHFLGRAGLGALLADDMGLGKTLQALAVFGPRTLVVAPTSLLANWREELARFRPELRVHTYHGADRELEQAAEVTLTTYALLRRDAERLARERFELVVLDEAQAIKNPDSQTARAAFALEAERRIALTGTPVENRLEELWSEMHFLNPGLLGGRGDFEERYARPLAAGDAEAARHLRERLRPFVLRRRKVEVAPELPPRTELVLHCVLSEPERAVYDAVRAATAPAVLERLARGGNVLEALEALLRMRQACCHPRLVPGQQLDASAKLELLIDRLETVAADGHKALVFSQWTALLDLVEPRLAASGLDFTRLDGSTRDRGEVVARFQREDGPPVFLISLRAGGVGLNLTAADHVFLLDPWWNPAVEDQAADRAHRIGQERPVLVHRLVAQDTVEERILALQESKRALAGAALGDVGGAAAELTREDLLALLRE
jgi:superfamily II DNA or RNA helicase